MFWLRYKISVKLYVGDNIFIPHWKCWLLLIGGVRRVSLSFRWPGVAYLHQRCLTCCATLASNQCLMATHSRNIWPLGASCVTIKKCLNSKEDQGIKCQRTLLAGYGCSSYRATHDQYACTVIFFLCSVRTWHMSVIQNIHVWCVNGR